MIRQNLSLPSTFPIKLDQPEEDPVVIQIRDVQCFLCLVISILKLFIFQQKYKQHTSNKKINSLGNKLY